MDSRVYSCQFPPAAAVALLVGRVTQHGTAWTDDREKAARASGMDEQDEDEDEVVALVAETRTRMSE